MSKQQILSMLIRMMLSLLVLAFLFVLFRSLGGSSRTSNSETAFDDVVIGQTALRRVAGQRVWVTRLSSVQRAQAKALGGSMVALNGGCEPEASLCAVATKTDRSGIEIVFSDAVPAALPSDMNWHGGFVDPTNGRVFDRLGRAYRLVGSNGVAGLEVVFVE